MKIDDWDKLEVMFSTASGRSFKLFTVPVGESPEYYIVVPANF